MDTEKLHQRDRERFKEREESVKLDRLVEKGEWTRLNESQEFRDMEVEGRIIQTGTAVTNRITQLTQFFGNALAERPDQSRVILDKMQHLRSVRKKLNGILVEHINGERVISKSTNIVSIVERGVQQDLKKAA
jgi:hypothetical protein